MSTESLFSEIDTLRGDVSNLKEQLNAVSGMLATLCVQYGASNRSMALRLTPLGRAFEEPLLQGWWKAYKSSEASAAAVIDAESKRKRVARAALRKLTDEERAALGLSSGKRV